MFNDWQNEPTLKMVMKKIGAAHEVLKYLGGGGSARVYKIRHKGLDQVQILKIMDFTYILNILEKKNVENLSREFEKTKQRFTSEAKIYRKLTHPNIAEIYEIGFVKHDSMNIGIPYLIMEYVEGKTLKEILEEKKKMDLKTIFKISRDVLTVLDSIHQKGIIHRDIKPSNIMIRNKTQEVVILDFGLAKDTIDNLAITDTHTAMGTLSYTSPEMLADSKTVTLQTDIYSFGIVLYEMITGELPFKGSSPEVLLGHLDPAKRFPKNQRITRGLNRILKKAMAKDATERFESASEFSKALQELEKEIDEKPKRKYYYLSIVLVLSIAAFFVLKSAIPEWQYQNLLSAAGEYIKKGDYPMALETLEKAKKNRGRVTVEIAALSNEIEKKHIKAMRDDFETLKKFLAGVATEKEKIEKCRTFLAKHQNSPLNRDTQEMRDEINRFISILNTGIKGDKQYQKYIDAVNKLINSKDYEGAEKELNKARKIQNSDEVKRLSAVITKGLETERINGEKEFKSIKDKLTLIQYLAFKRKYPQSSHLQELRDRLKTADKNLPPEKYWNKPLRKNEKGYYAAILILAIRKKNLPVRARRTAMPLT